MGLLLVAGWLAGWLAGGLAQGAEARAGFKTIALAPGAGAVGAPALRGLFALPQGRQVVQGVAFDIGAPVVVTGLDAARGGEVFPTEVRGIPVGAKARRLHLLHGVMAEERDGVPLAKIVLHYADGTTASLRLGYGIHARDWTPGRAEKKEELYDPNSRVAWGEGEAAGARGRRIYHTVLENPRAEETILSLDVVSLFSRATAFVLAVSAEEAGAGLPASLPLPERKVVREFLAAGDAGCRREIAVRVTDAEGGRPLTNAVVSLAVADNEKVFFLGETRADAGGVWRVAYPPPSTVGYTLWAHAPGRMPGLVAEWREVRTNFSQAHTIALARGTKIGGVVKQADGQPVAGAEVFVYMVTLGVPPRTYGRVDYARAVTGPDGRWTSSSLAGDLSGLGFDVVHPEFRPASYQTAGGLAAPVEVLGFRQPMRLETGRLTVLTEGGPSVQVQPSRRPGFGTRLPSIAQLTTNALADGSAEMTVQPAPLLEGTLVDKNDQPVSGAEIIVQRPDATGRKYLRSDAQGNFRTRVAEAGPAALIITREGFAPTYLGISVVPGAPPTRLQLSPARTLRGRVLDQNQRPVPGAKVRLTDWQGTGDLLRFQAVTDAEGRFTWAGAPVDSIVLQASQTNYSSMRAAFAGGGEEVTINLQRSPGVYGKVFDAATRQPVESFTLIPGRKYSPNETQIHWERSGRTRGRDGEYSLEVNNYMFQPEARVLVEAPGYEPQISPPFRGAGSYTNDFALKKGRGISGTVVRPDGSPAVGASLLLAERGEHASLEMGGQLRGSGSAADAVRSDAQGRFEFTPRLDPDKIFASHEAGFAELKPAGPGATNRVVLQPWGRLSGARRVGDGTEGTVRLQNRPERSDGSESSPALCSFYWKAEPDTNGQFLFDRVPPGEHRLALEYRFKENNSYGETPLSHGFNVVVKPGELTEATLGGTGRQVTGQVKLTGADHSDLDWKRDVHKLTLVLSNPIAPPVFIPGISSLNQQQVWNDFNTRQQSFGQTEAGRVFARAERTYVLLFDTNGAFRADHVPPGKYMLMLNVTDPEEDNYSRRTIGSGGREITVPDEAGAQVNAPFSIGDVDLAVRMRVKTGSVVPPFEAKTGDGRTFKLAEQRGKYVLLHFWGQSTGWSLSDIQTLQQLQSSQSGRTNLVVIGCNLDSSAVQIDQFARNQRMTWPQLLLGDWNQSPVASLFGIQGNTACALIDPDGKLVRTSLRGSAIRTAVENLLETE